MEIKIESIKYKCDTCLSVGRKLSSLGTYGPLFSGIMAISGFEIDPHLLYNMDVCWECRALLGGVAKFQAKVKSASEMHRLSMQHHRPLSSLNSTLITSDHPTYYNFEECEEKVADTKLIDIKIEETSHTDVGGLNSYENEDLSDDNIYVDLKDDTIDNKEEEINKATEQSERRAYRKRKKYTVIEMTDEKQMWQKLPISEEEMLEIIEKERKSQFYMEKTFKCEKCVLGFRSVKLLLRHNASSHKKGSASLTCKFCLTTLPSRLSLKTHTKTHYFKYVCMRCDVTTYTHQHIRWHYTHMHRRVLRCTQCGIAFDTRRHVIEHYKNMHETFVCDLCGIVKKHRNSIEKHIKVAHSPFECHECNKRFARKKYLLLHNRVRHMHHKTENAYCVECDKHFSNVYAYRSHLNETMKHSAKKKARIPCPECEKVFTKRIYMRNHYELVHLKLNKYRCEQCEKNFLRQDHLVRHTRLVHEGIPKLKNKMCYICGRGFSGNNILANHMRTHTGERPFACTRCPAKFAQSSALVSHTRSVHKEKYVIDNNMGHVPM